MNSIKPNIYIRAIQSSDNVALAEMIRGVFIEHDAPQIGTVFSDPTTDDLYNLFRKSSSALWVAEVDNVVKGCCGIYPTDGLPKNYAELVKFYIDSSIRNLGIGKQLMEKTIDTAKLLGYTHIYLESLPHYDKAINIYRKQGFDHIDAALGHSGHTTCNVWMVKKIQ